VFRFTIFLIFCFNQSIAQPLVIKPVKLHIVSNTFLAGNSNNSKFYYANSFSNNLNAKKDYQIHYNFAYTFDKKYRIKFSANHGNIGQLNSYSFKPSFSFLKFFKISKRRNTKLGILLEPNIGYQFGKYITPPFDASFESYYLDLASYFIFHKKIYFAINFGTAFLNYKKIKHKSIFIGERQLLTLDILKNFDPFVLNEINTKLNFEINKSIAIFIKYNLLLFDHSLNRIDSTLFSTNNNILFSDISNWSAFNFGITVGS